MKLISVKEFEERIETCFQSFTADDYKNYIQKKAEQISPPGREAFIAELESARKPETPAPRKKAEKQDSEFDPDAYAEEWRDKIAAFAEAYDDLVDRYENNEYDEYEYDYYSDELGLEDMSGYSELREAGYEIFLAARDLFNNGHYGQAKIIYGQMADVLSEMSYDLYSLYSDDESISFAEEFSRFLRCVYLSEQAENRAEAMYEYMEGGMFESEHINLKSILGCAKEELADINEFLPVWKEYLLTQPLPQNDGSYSTGGKNTNYLIREAAGMIGGTEEIKNLALSYGDRYPEAYLDWIALEKNAGNTITDICLRAVEQVRNSAVGIKICEHLAEEAEKNGNTGNCLTAWKRAFKYRRDVRHLVNIFKYAKIENCFRDALEYVTGEAGSLANNDEKRRITFHAGLLSGDIEAAYDICKNDSAIGWSNYNSYAPVLAGFLMRLFSWGKQDTAKIVKFWNLYAGDLNRDCGYDNLIEESIADIELDDAQKQHYYKWCEDICGRRVDDIVSNQRRGAYYKAALALVACAAAKGVLYGKQEGTALIDKYVLKYPRHNKFRAEVKNV